MTVDQCKSLLIVEDDRALAQALRRSFQRRGFTVRECATTDEVVTAMADDPPAYAVVDLKLTRGTGLECVKLLRTGNPAMNIVVLTGFASIATAVEAIKLGACHYLAKPSTADDIEAAFMRNEGNPDVSLPHRQSTIKTLEWEHIHETLAEAGFNISEAARRLGMHRRTLARKLGKRRL